MLNSLYHGGYGLAVRSSQTEKAKSFDGNYLEIRYDLASTPFATHTEKSRGKTPVQTSQYWEAGLSLLYWPSPISTIAMSVGGPGICALRGSCGLSIYYGLDVPCPDDGEANEVSIQMLVPVFPLHRAGVDMSQPSAELSSLLSVVCGPSFQVPDSVCCTLDQAKTLANRLQQAAPLIASCPACINNFRAFFCDFTCSPDQSNFVRVNDTQKTRDGRVAVKEVDYAVSTEFKDGFYESCKNVQFGATNGFAMDLIGGGAKTPSAFLRYMGDFRPGLGSPFQINFPDEPSGFSRRPLNCAESSPDARCACVDCPSTCPTLPYVAPPSSSTCHVGAVSCLTFSLLVIYSVAILLGLLFYSWKQALRHRQQRYEPVALLDPPLSPSADGVQNGLNGLVGLGEDSESGPSGSIHFRLGRGASLLDPMDHMQPKQNKINATLRRFFYRLGLVCAWRPAETFVIAAVVVAALNIGWRYFAVETDPVRLWVSPSSESAAQKHFFDDNFGPFYRTEQVFITSTSGDSVLSRDTLKWWLEAEDEIRFMNTESGVRLDQVCFAPAGRGRSSKDTYCAIQSISAWITNELDDDDDLWQRTILDCAARPGECLPGFGQPVDPKLILGGADGDWLNAKALVITWVLDNYNDDRVQKAEEWERMLRGYLSGLSRGGLKISYSTGVSLEEELNKSTNTDVKIVVLSYLVMFLYVSLTLGGGLPPTVISSFTHYLWTGIVKLAVLLHIAEPSAPDQSSSPPNLLVISTLLSVNSKFSLGLFGIVIVLVAVSSSVGLFSLLGVRVTLIIAEVIPFLVLAVGVDNVFILVHELERQNSLHSQSPNGPSPADGEDGDDAQHPSGSLPAEERVARAVARMGPSIALSSITETVAFALGALVPMPAVRNFAIYAAGSVFFGAVLQVTVFVSAMAMDLRRAEDMRIDCVPCIRLRPPIGFYDRVTSPEGVVAKFIRRIYAPALLQHEVKQLVLGLFGGLFLTAIVGIQHITLGLDQRLALPAESYLVPYFNDLDDFLDVGPPVYFVATGADMPSRHGQQQLCGRFTTCLELSVANSLEAERKRPDSSFLASPPAAWIDDFLQWTNPTFDSCCRVRKADPSVFCTARDSDRVCRPCFTDQEWDITMAGLPEGSDFMRYLQQWLISPTNEACPLGGQAPYSSAVKIGSDNTTVTASHFRTYHTPLKSQADFINAMTAAQRISADITHRTGIKVFPYSLFYVFFDQYEHVVSIAFQVISLALFAIFMITSILLGSWRTGATVTAVCALAVTNVMGVMGFWGISLNAISLVNLVISLGIAVEFCSHIARAFMGAGSGMPFEKDGKREKDERAITALVDVGPSVRPLTTFNPPLMCPIMVYRCSQESP